MSVPMCSRYISPRLRVGQVWYKVAYYDYWYEIKGIDEYGNVYCWVYRPNGTWYETMVWAYQFDRGWLVFNKVKLNRPLPFWKRERDGILLSAAQRSETK